MKTLNLISWGGVCVLMLIVAVGCQNDIQKNGIAPHDPLTSAQNADLERNTEVQLVEQMSRYRQKYHQHLALLQEFYDRQGNQLKAEWAAAELEHFKLAPQRGYLIVAELAGPDLRARIAIPQADLLYDQAMELAKQGAPKLAHFFGKEKMLYLAIDKFNELIGTYSTSDKIDDAAFQIAQINRRYLKDYSTALLYYQRSWQWDPQTNLPSRYAAALIYDEHIHDRIKAIQYYELAIKFESAYPSNVLDAQKRIKALNTELEELSDGE